MKGGSQKVKDKGRQRKRKERKRNGREKEREIGRKGRKVGKKGKKKGKNKEKSEGKAKRKKKEKQEIKIQRGKEETAGILLQEECREGRSREQGRGWWAWWGFPSFLGAHPASPGVAEDLAYHHLHPRPQCLSWCPLVSAAMATGEVETHS